MVASRWPWRLDFLAAAIKRSISAVVRYSRARTEEFTVVGADRRPLRFSTIFRPRSQITSELSGVSSLVSIGTVGWYHGQPWPEVSRPVQVDQHEALPHGSCRWTTEDFAICCANHARQRAVMVQFKRRV